MLQTEQRNPLTTQLDQLDTLAMVHLFQKENLKAIQAVDAAAEQIAFVADAIAARMEQGGRLFYIGCGTSGRLGVLDASECPPTFGVSPELVIGIIAGGDAALRRSAEAQEDSRDAGILDIQPFALTPSDSVVGISAAGGAEYVIGALEFARSQGALTIALTSNADVPITRAAELSIVTDTGPEPLTGSTRMKAGTAQKAVLNTLSTSVFVRLGCVYENLMINLQPTNKKLHTRMLHIVDALLGCGEQEAEALLEKSGWNIQRTVQSRKEGML